MLVPSAFPRCITLAQEGQVLVLFFVWAFLVVVAVSSTVDPPGFSLLPGRTLFFPTGRGGGREGHHREAACAALDFEVGLICRRLIGGSTLTAGVKLTGAASFTGGAKLTGGRLA